MSAENNRPRLNPARALTHPIWLGALLLLVVNDHLLKSSPWAGVMTGKLSDIAGLLLAPALLAALIGVRSRRGLWFSGAAVAAVFSAINLSPELAAMWDGMISLVVSSHTTVDPSDLLTLPAIPLGLWLLRDHMVAFDAPPAHRLVALQGLLCALGVAASLGSSVPPESECMDCGWTQEITMGSQVSVLNHTHELHELRVRYLQPGVRLDCERVAEDPNAYLSDELFGTPERWLLQSGQQIGLNTFAQENACVAALIESDTTPDTLIFWDADLPRKSFTFDPDVPKEIPADPQTVVLEADYEGVADGELKPYRFRTDCGAFADRCEAQTLAPAAEIPAGARYFWHSENDTPLHFVRPPAESAPTDNTSAACAIPGPGQGLEWSDPPLGWVFVTGVEEGVDGCHAIGVGQPDGDGVLQEDDTWWLCAPIDSLDLLLPNEERRVTISVEPRLWNSPGASHQALRIDVEHIPVDAPQPEAGSPDWIYRVGTVSLSRGAEIPEMDDLAVVLNPRESCGPQPRACGEVLVPVDVRLDGEELTPGVAVEIGEVMQREVTLVRAARRPVAAIACASGDEDDANARQRALEPSLIEAVVVRRLEGGDE